MPDRHKNVNYQAVRKAPWEVAVVVDNVFLRKLSGASRGNGSNHHHHQPGRASELLVLNSIGQQDYAAVSTQPTIPTARVN